MLRRRHCGLFRVISCAVIAVAFSVPLYAQQTAEDKELARKAAEAEELTTYATGLMNWGLSDYARIVMDRITKSQGGGIAPAGLVSFDLQTSIMAGKYGDAARKLAAIDKTKFENWKGLLDAADAYFSQGMWTNTQALYDDFFARFTTPPTGRDEFYKDVACKYATIMDRYVKNPAKAYNAYLAAMKARPTTDEKLMFEVEMGQLALKAATKSPPGTARDQWVAIAQKCAEDVQWSGQGTVWFGKSVVIVAHVAMLKGDRQKAMSTIDDHMENLKAIHQAILDSGDKEWIKLTPMAECRFLLGKLYYDQGMDLIKANKKKEGVTYLGKAVNDLYNVFVKYPSTSWAPQAGKLADELFDYFEKNKIPFTRPPAFHLRDVMRIQFQEARMMMLGQQFENAIDKYVDILTIFPEEEDSIIAMADLANCYFGFKQADYGMAVAGHIVERFSKNPKRMERAGDAILMLAAARKDAKDIAGAGKLYDHLIAGFPNHPKRPMVLLYRADVQREAGNLDAAMEVYKGMKKTDEGYDMALSSMAYIYSQRTNYMEEARVLNELVTVSKPGHEKCRSQYRMAQALMNMGKQQLAAGQFQKAMEMLKDPENAPTPDASAKNKEMLGYVLYTLAGCHAQIKEPPEKRLEGQQKAIKLYDEFATDYLAMKVAPDAVLRMAILQSITGDTAGATKSFDRLKRNWPDSEQAKGMYYHQISALISLKYIPEARQSVSKMLNNADQYNAQQFIQVGRLMGENGEADVAARCYEQAMGMAKDPEKDKWIIELALFSMGEFNTKNRRYREAADNFKQLFEKFPNTSHTVEGSFLQCEACSEMAGNEKDPAVRREGFNDAARALNRVANVYRSAAWSKRPEAPSAKARIALKSANVYEMRARAEERYGTPEAAADAKKSAAGSYYHMFELMDPSGEGVGPYIEEAFSKLIPLEKEIGKKENVAKYCKKYLATFPEGKYRADAQKWFDEAGVTPVEDEEAEGAAATNAAPSAATAPAGTNQSPAAAATPEPAKDHAATVATPAPAVEQPVVPPAQLDDAAGGSGLEEPVVPVVPEPTSSSQPGEAK